MEVAGTMLGFERSHASPSDSQMQGKAEAAGCEVATSLNDVSKPECDFGFAPTHLIFFEGRGQKANVCIVLT